MLSASQPRMRSRHIQDITSHHGAALARAHRTTRWRRSDTTLTFSVRSINTRTTATPSGRPFSLSLSRPHPVSPDDALRLSWRRYTAHAGPLTPPPPRPVVPKTSTSRADKSTICAAGPQRRRIRPEWGCTPRMENCGAPFTPSPWRPGRASRPRSRGRSPRRRRPRPVPKPTRRPRASARRRAPGLATAACCRAR